jgi:hypothetical protein
LNREASALTPWMWGINGACGVLASVTAVAISMWFGINTNLWAAAAFYLILTWPLRAMAAGLPARSPHSRQEAVTAPEPAA